MADSNYIDKKIKAEKDYVRGLTYQQIADKYEVSINTVKSWKQRYNWKRPSTKKEREARKTKGAHKGNIFAKGSKGNKNAKPPIGNQNALKHGFYSKYIPKETLELMGNVTSDPSELVWTQITIQYAAIIRAQGIMYVEDRDDNTTTVKRTKEVKGVIEEEYETIHSFDKQSNFLTAQSRAMAELRNLIKQFRDIAHEDDERLLRLEQMQLNIDKTKVEIENLGKGDTDEHVIIVTNIDEMDRVINERAKADTDNGLD